jgi:hypothetical protein
VSVKRYSQRPDQIEAIQLISDQADPTVGNFRDVALFFGGRASWTFDTETMSEILELREDESMPPVLVEPGSWVIRRKGGRPFVMDDTQFKARKYEEDPDLGVFDKPETCPVCLADPKHTPQGNDGEKLCSHCGARYTGPPREREFLVLKQAGLVKED